LFTARIRDPCLGIGIDRVRPEPECGRVPSNKFELSVKRVMGGAPNRESRALPLGETFSFEGNGIVTKCRPGGPRRRDCRSVVDKGGSAGLGE